MSCVVTAPPVSGCKAGDCALLCICTPHASCSRLAVQNHHRVGYIVHVCCPATRILCSVGGTVLSCRAQQAALDGTSNSSSTHHARQQRSVQVYIQKNGTLRLPIRGRGLTPVLIAEIPALQRRGLPLTQLHTQAAIRAAVDVAPGGNSSSSTKNNNIKGSKHAAAGAASGGHGLRMVDVGSWGAADPGSVAGMDGGDWGAADGPALAAPPGTAGGGFAPPFDNPVAAAAPQKADAAGEAGAAAAGAGAGDPMDWVASGESAAVVVAHTGDLDSWVLANVADGARRRHICSQLSAVSLPWGESM